MTLPDGPIPALRSSTLAVHAGEADRVPGQPVVSPLAQSATFFWSKPEDGELRYTRHGNNPNQLQVARKVAALEGAEAAVVLNSGMAATAMTLLALTRAGDHIVASNLLYGATHALLGDELRRRGVTTNFVDPLVGREWRPALRPETRLIFLEMPTNPTLRVVDPRPIAQLAHERGLVLVMDATFASPVNMRATALGADVVIHSATKYLGGHSDLIAGVVAGSRAVVDEVLSVARLYGPTVDPHTAWLLDRGLRTLEVRMRRHNDNAAALARWFSEQPEVETVLYPGLPEHPDHDVAREVLEGFGGMLSVVLRGGGEAADRFTDALEVAIAAPSLGGVETLVSQPRHTSHVALSPAERLAAGIPDGFVRISVGIEDVGDLQADFRRALDALA